jgi:hypothetical protein
VELIAKLAEPTKEESDACAKSLPNESEEERRQRILRQKMRVLPKRPSVEKSPAEEASSTG